MAPNIKDQLPILKQIIQYFKKDGILLDSPLFRLHNQMSCMVIGIGFIFISVENYLDTKAILCHSGQQFHAYAKSYCWIHGTAYVRPQLQGRATGCFVDQSKLESEEDAPITAYYLWLPYLLSLLFVLAKAPHSAWKRFFENNLIAHILGGATSSMDQTQHNWSAFGGPHGPTPGGMGRKQRKMKSGPSEIAQNFIEYRRRGKYDRYHKKFAFWEGFNLVSVFLSMCVTHWILNYNFMNYGMEVIEYVTYYGRSHAMHDPMCELFPTEVACNINVGSLTGALDRTNFLCILGNNLFNQKYFFVLWLWWIFLMLITMVGILYRWSRIAMPGLSRYLLSRKVHGGHLDRLNLTSGECFVLEMVIDNLRQTPTLATAMLEELESRLADQEMRSMAWKLADEEDGYKGDSYSVHNTSGYLGQNLAHAQNSPTKTQSTPAPNAPQHPGDRHRHLSQDGMPRGVVKISEESLPLYPGMPSEV
jgi:hypothetical protein